MIHFICFSRKRPLQLHGYLTSLFRQCPTGVSASVILRVDNGYERAYEEVMRQFPEVVFVYETTFSNSLSATINHTDAKFVSFGCDDVVISKPIYPDRVEELFGRVGESTVKPILGISLRLGEQVATNMFGTPLPKPEFDWVITGATVPSVLWYLWNASHPSSVGDWAYPWEVIGTIYPIEYARKMVDAIGADSPSQLEERGSHVWAEHTDRRWMATYTTSRLVAPTVNIVQSEFPGNGIAGTSKPLTPDFLLNCWVNGLRLDTERYDGMVQATWRVGDFFLRRI